MSTFSKAKTDRLKETSIQKDGQIISRSVSKIPLIKARKTENQENDLINTPTKMKTTSNGLLTPKTNINGTVNKDLNKSGTVLKSALKNTTKGQNNNRKVNFNTDILDADFKRLVLETPMKTLRDNEKVVILIEYEI